MIPQRPKPYHKDKIIYPAYVQPFLRGIRTLYQNGTFQSECDWSPDVMNIAKDLQDIFPPKVVLDGVIHDGDYHVFDLVTFKTPFKDRFDAAAQVLRDSRQYHKVFVVPTRKMFDNEQADDQFNTWANEGYPGMIYRLGHCYYTKRTSKNPENYNNQLLLREIA